MNKDNKPGPVARRKMVADSIGNGRTLKAMKSAQYLDQLSRSQTASRDQMIRNRIENPPTYTDSLAVYNRNNKGANAWTPIANAAEDMYGKMDVSGFKPSVSKRADISGARKKYNL